ncbi:MAG: acyltransferase domain-containing protein, partial [Acidobacteria bacterium]|nr:acyltransferase domain-containing protein [Acidobacteriota bacterium]
LAASGETLKTGTSYIAPQNDIEKTIAQVWQEILGVENIGIHDHFFDRGGNSLSIIRLSSRLSQALQTDIPVVTLFNNPTISALANYLRPGKQENTFNKNENSLQIEAGEIAVIGMAGRFPRAKNIDQFWDNLKNGVEAITFFSKEELLQMEVNPEWLSNPDYLYVPAKGVLPGHDCFDAFFFGYTPVEAGVMDPQVRIFHECVWEALENAAYDPGNYPGTIGLFAGASPNPFWEILPLRSSAGGKDYPGLWNAIQFSDKDYLSTRVAYKLDLKGPCITLQTACSTSLVAVDQACRALLNNACDIALAGGVSVTLHDQAGYLYQEGTIMSPDGHCRAFDAQARGTVGGNGAGVVVLKPLTAAIADGDQVFAIIKGLGITNDGKNKVGFTAPSSDGQAAAINAALNMAGFSPESIGYIEAHGTGTPLGDPIEIEGLKKAFNTQPSKQTKSCAIGSVKTNIGHLDAAAGIAGFIKTVLILHHRMIPPSLFFEQPNPAINFENSPFYVNTVLKKWESKEYPLRAGVSSFGLGGTNVHVVLEAYAKEQLEMKHSTIYYLIPLSAKTQNALDHLTVNLAHHFEHNPNIDLADAAYTLQIGRKAFKHRCMLVSGSMSETMKRMSSGEMESGLAFAEKSTVIFMFSGQGSQYVNMGLDLYQNEPVFHDLINQCFTILEKITGLDMKYVLYPAANRLKEAEELIYQFLYTTPIKFIFEYALAKLLISWGIEPDAMIGHSFGEYVAACLAGVFSLEDGIYLAALRGEAMHSLPEGAMLSVPLSEEELSPLLNEQLSLATVDAPSLSVVSGPVDAIEAFAKQLNDMGHESIRFRVPKAGHSRMVEPIQPEFKKKISQKTFNKPTIPYISGMSGKWITAEEATNPDYWVRHLRATVRFADGLTTLFKEPNPIFLQVGPGKGLTMFANRHPSMKPGIPTFNMLRHPKEETTDRCYLLNQVGRLWLQGVKINWPAFHVGQNRRRISLPTYPFEENVFPVPGNLFKLDASTTIAITAASSPTPVLKKNPDIGAWFYIPSWERTSSCRREGLHKPGLKEENLPAVSSECALIIMDRSGIGRQLKEELEARGHEVFICENENVDDFIKKLAQQDKFPYRVYHLPGIDPISNPGEPGYRVDDALDRGFYSLLALTQALGKLPGHPPGIPNDSLPLQRYFTYTCKARRSLANINRRPL